MEEQVAAALDSFTRRVSSGVKYPNQVASHAARYHAMDNITV